MNVRFRPASVVAMIALATACAGVAFAADTTPVKGPAPGRAGIGGQIGSSYIFAGGDYADGAQPRLSFAGHFRYQIDSHWGWQFSPQFTWNGYVSHVDAPYLAENSVGNNFTKQRYITQIAGLGSQLQYFGGDAGTRWHVGFGPAIYRVVVQNNRKVVRDTLSKELVRGAHLGASAEFGIERMNKRLPNTSLEATVALQTVFAGDDTKYASGWNGTPMLVEVRIGGHYYYDFRRPKPAAKGAKGLTK